MKFSESSPARMSSSGKLKYEKLQRLFLSMTLVAYFGVRESGISNFNGLFTFACWVDNVKWLSERFHEGNAIKNRRHQQFPSVSSHLVQRDLAFLLC
jgi:hypothetical protein